MKVAKIEGCQNEGCQNWRLPKLKVAKIARIVKIENCQVVKLLGFRNMQEKLENDKI